MPSPIFSLRAFRFWRDNGHDLKNKSESEKASFCFGHFYLRQNANDMNTIQIPGFPKEKQGGGLP